MDKKISFAPLLFFLLFTSPGFSQADCGKYPKDHIPKNLNDALDYMDCVWADKEAFKNKSEKDAVVEAHFTGGQWQVIISKYQPTMLGTCQHAIKWSEDLAEEWLASNMCPGDKTKAKKILKEFSDHNANRPHARHISRDKCSQIGLTIETIEADNTFQDLLLSVHHSFMHTFTQTSSVKIVENHMGVAYIEQAAPQMMPFQIPNLRPQLPGTAEVQ